MIIPTLLDDLGSVEGDNVMTIHEKLDKLLEEKTYKTQSVTLTPTSTNEVAYFTFNFIFNKLEKVLGITYFYSSNTLVAAPVDCTISGNVVAVKFYGAHATQFTARVDAIGY